MPGHRGDCRLPCGRVKIKGGQKNGTYKWGAGIAVSCDRAGKAFEGGREEMSAVFLQREKTYQFLGKWRRASRNSSADDSMGLIIWLGFPEKAHRKSVPLLGARAAGGGGLPMGRPQPVGGVACAVMVGSKRHLGYVLFVWGQDVPAKLRHQQRH